jgi:hypothetical protein
MGSSGMRWICDVSHNFLSHMQSGDMHSRSRGVFSLVNGLGLARARYATCLSHLLVYSDRSNY